MPSSPDDVPVLLSVEAPLAAARRVAGQYCCYFLINAMMLFTVFTMTADCTCTHTKFLTK